LEYEKSEINFHRSGNFISVQMIEGKIKLSTTQQCGILNKGSLITIHGNMQHSFLAVEESVLLLTIAL
jgi:quercetin dioxygenase-like cupin family protein